MRSKGETYVKRMIGTVVDLLEVILHPLHTLLERALIETVQIRIVDLEPPQTRLPQGLRLAELQ